MSLRNLVIKMSGPPVTLCILSDDTVVLIL
jgi:hypothetical protein